MTDILADSHAGTLIIGMAHEGVLECRLREGQGPESEMYGRLARRQGIGFKQGPLAWVRKQGVALQREPGKPAVLIRKDVVDEGPQAFIRELIV